MKTKKNLIIPMAGVGKRFKLAGYDTYKPFIKINGKYMIDYVLDAFPKYVKKHVVTCENLISKTQKKHLRSKNCNIIYIERHTKGPSYSIYLAKDKLPLEESFFISYADIAWKWNWKKIISLLKEDGIVFVNRGFHPHLIKNNYSAFCKKSLSNKLIKIKEKGSFTNNHLEEDLSIGVFYVKSGYNMISALNRQISKNLKTNNEFFPSLIFNELTKDKRSISLEKVDAFIHWGVPEQLHDFLNWQNKIKHLSKKILFKKKFDTVITMAGSGSRMQGLSEKPKALIKVNKLAMYQYVCKFFPVKKKYIIISNSIKNQIKNFNQNVFYTLAKKTKSQFETIKLSKNIFKGKKNFFLLSCDAFGLFNKKNFFKFVYSKKADVIVFTFSPSLTQSKFSNQHTHVACKRDLIKKIFIKSKKTKNDLGLAGFFWVKCGDTFNSVVEKIDLSNFSREVLADDVIKKYIDIGYRVFNFPLDSYIHIGTKNELLELKYWLDNKNVFFNESIKKK